MVGIVNLELVSSYNCVGSSDSRKIIVPGLPAKWVGLQGKRLAVKPDTGVRALDQNRIRWPSSPMEPAICAVLKLHPNFDFTDLDLISDRRALGSLLELAGEGNHRLSQVKAFGFGAVLVGNTVIFIRKDEPVEVTSSFNGCRYNFEEHALEKSEDFDDSNGHQRIVRFKIGELTMMMRHSVDGYFTSDDEKLVAAMATYQTPVGDVTIVANTTVEIGGALLPQSAVLDLVTKKKRKAVRHVYINKKLRETWLSGTAHFMTAEYWTIPDFPSPEDLERVVCHFTEDNLHHEPGLAGGRTAETWEERNQSVVQRFHDMLLDVIKTIREATEAGDGSTYMVTYAEGKLAVLAAPARIVSALPEELCERIKAKPE